MWSKFLPYLPWVLLVLVVFTAGGLGYRVNGQNQKLETYNRQLQGQLTKKERELTEANQTLGTLNSQLLTQQSLNEALSEEKSTITQEFKDFIDRHNLQIREKERVIARLQKELQGGTTTVQPGVFCDQIGDNCVIAYSWQDQYGRFKLTDPNIFQSGDETFISNQHFKIYGEVYEQKEGSLLTKRLVLRELYKDGDQYKEIPDGEMEILESDFKYSNPPLVDESSWTDVFRLRGVAGVSVQLFPKPGTMRLALGFQFLQWEGIGVNSHTAIDFEDFKNWEQRLGVTYSPTFWGLDLNFGLSVSVGTPFMAFGQMWTFNTGVVFYLNN